MNRHEGFNDNWTRFMADLDKLKLPYDVASPCAHTQALYLIGGELAYMNDVLGKLIETIRTKEK